MSTSRDGVIYFDMQSGPSYHNVVKGKDMPKRKYIKILSNDWKHKGFQYKEGMNIDTRPFNPSGSCLGGGLYFTDEEHFTEFIQYGTKIADVEIPDDAQVYADPCGEKWKADKIIIKNIREIKDLPQWQDINFCGHLIDRFLRTSIIAHICKLGIESPILKQILIDRYNRTRKYLTTVSKEVPILSGVTASEFVYLARSLKADLLEIQSLLQNL
jgi:hypothetical protein